MNILFISPWYPNRYDSMAGLFVQKHAEAVSLYADVKVLYVHPDVSINHFETVVNHHNKLEEFHIYYPASNRSIIKKIINGINFLKAYKQGFDRLNKTGWKADILHTNVLTRTPFIGFINKITTGTPYVITEHWTKFLKVRNDFKGIGRKILARMVVKNASYILPVSIELLEGLKFNNLLLTKYEIIENVVDKCFYIRYAVEKKIHKKQIINITCFYEKQKNLFGLLRAVKEISGLRDDFELILIGEGNDFEITKTYCSSLNLPDGMIHFAGLKTSEQVAKIMQSADFVVQFSNYESAGVVVEEALVSGKPVISTRVGLAPDFINDTNGLLVEAGNEAQLVAAIHKVLDNLENYNSEEIKKNASELFSYEHIGRKIMDIYDEILNNSKQNISEK